LAGCEADDMKKAVEDLRGVVVKQQEEIGHLQDMLQRLTARPCASGNWQCAFQAFMFC